MPEISVDTMVIAIQAVAAQQRRLEAAAEDEGAAPEVDMLVEEWSDAAGDLEAAYNTASRTILNLPPYDKLVGDRRA